MNQPPDWPEEAGRLLAFALSRGRGADPQHRELIRRYRTDGGFRGAVDAIGRGLGLRVLDVTEQGLALAADADSPFAFKLSDFRQNLSVEDRLCHGLIQVAIAAWCFPNAASLEDDDRALVSISTTDLLDYLLRACEELQRRATADPEMARPELREAWSVVLAQAETRDTGDGRRAASTLTGKAGWALERLEKEGFFRQTGKERGGTWLMRDAYRVHVRELAAHEAYRLLLTVQKEQG